MKKWKNTYNQRSTKMPGCPRKKGLPKKIAFSILGTPPNLKDKKTARQKEVDHKLLYENTQRVR